MIPNQSDLQPFHPIPSNAARCVLRETRIAYDIAKHL
jgi:hypothetical protein